MGSLQESLRSKCSLLEGRSLGEVAPSPLQGKKEGGLIGAQGQLLTFWAIQENRVLCWKEILIFVNVSRILDKFSGCQPAAPHFLVCSSSLWGVRSVL